MRKYSLHIILLLVFFAGGVFIVSAQKVTEPKTKEEWVKLFKKTFRFTGGEIVNEFLMSTGYLQGAHEPGCPIYKKILKANPLWLKK